MWSTQWKMLIIIILNNAVSEQKSINCLERENLASEWCLNFGKVWQGFEEFAKRVLKGPNGLDLGESKASILEFRFQAGLIDHSDCAFETLKLKFWMLQKIETIRGAQGRLIRLDPARPGQIILHWVAEFAWFHLIAIWFRWIFY